MIKNAKNHFLLLKKLKNTKSAQLWLELLLNGRTAPPFEEHKGEGKEVESVGTDFFPRWRKNIDDCFLLLPKSFPVGGFFGTTTSGHGQCVNVGLIFISPRKHSLIWDSPKVEHYWRLLTIHLKTKTPNLFKKKTKVNRTLEK